MEHSVRPFNPVPFVFLFIVGFANLVHFSPNVRAVDAVGLSGGGFAIGLAAFAVISALRARAKA
jgi:hypothetical protein